MAINYIASYNPDNLTWDVLGHNTITKGVSLIRRFSTEQDAVKYLNKIKR